MFPLGLFGLGMFRRTLAMALVVAGFLGGMEWQATVLANRCETAGGTVGVDKLCRGLP